MKKTLCKSQSIPSIYLSPPLLHAEFFFLIFLDKLKKNRDILPAQFLRHRALYCPIQGKKITSYAEEHLPYWTEFSEATCKVTHSPYERSNSLSTAYSTLHSDSGCFVWLLVETEYNCARLQVHIPQMVGVQLLAARDIVALHWPVRNTSDDFISCVSSQIPNRSEHSAIIGLRFCANQQAAWILKEQIKWTML